MAKSTFLKKHSGFIGNVAVMMSGKAVAAVIALATMPIIARLFSPDHFGVAAVYGSIVGILSTLATLRYGAAIVLPDGQSDASDLMAFCYRLMLTICGLLIVALVAYEITGLSIAALEILGPWKWLLPAGILTMGAIHINESWLTRTRSFRTISTSLVIGNATSSASRIAFGTASGSTIYGLIVGETLGTFFRLIAQRSALVDAYQAMRNFSGWAKTKSIAKQYSDFPKFNAPAGFIFSMGQNLPVLLFGVMFSPAVAGFYAMANRLSQTPVNIVAMSVRRVFLQKAATIKNERRSLKKAYLLSTATLSLIGAFPFACLWFFGQELAVLLLGDNWSEAGRFLEIISPWLFMKWAASPCNAIFVVLRKQKLWLTLTSVLTALRLAGFSVAHIMSMNPEDTLQLFVVVSVIGILLTGLATLILIARDSLEPDNSSQSKQDARLEDSPSIGQ